MWLVDNRDRYLQATQSCATFLLYLPLPPHAPVWQLLLMSSWAMFNLTTASSFSQAMNKCLRAREVIFTDIFYWRQIINRFVFHTYTSYILLVSTGWVFALAGCTECNHHVLSLTKDGYIWLYLHLSAIACVSTLSFLFLLLSKGSTTREMNVEVCIEVQHPRETLLYCVKADRNIRFFSFLLVSMQLAKGINAGQGLGIEIIATLQLVLCVLATTDRRRNDVSGSAPLAIGLSVALGHLLAVSFSSHLGCVQYSSSIWAGEER